MILGRIIGKSSTTQFKFLVQSNAKKFNYVEILDEEGHDVLAQIVEIERDNNETVADCIIFGYRDQGKLKPLLRPLIPGREVLLASESLIMQVLGLDQEKKKGYIGLLDGYDQISVHLDLTTLLTKHVSILAKSGSGKCLSPDTELLLSDGSKTRIGEFVDSHLREGYKEEEGVEYSLHNPHRLSVLSISNMEQYKSPIKAFMRRKSPSNLIRLKTRTGNVLELTEEHLVPVFHEGIQWVEARALKEGDYSCLLKPHLLGKETVLDFIDLWINSKEVGIGSDLIAFSIRNALSHKEMTLKRLSVCLDCSYGSVLNWFNQKSFPIKYLTLICRILDLKFDDFVKNISLLNRRGKHIPSRMNLNQDFARFYSYLLAEGHNTGEVLVFTNSDPLIMQDYSNLAYNLFNETVSKTRYNEVRIYNKLLAQTLLKLGFTGSSQSKFIFDDLFTSKEEILWSFLGSFIDCDGHLCKTKGGVEITLASEKLIHNIHSIFLRLGIVGVIKTRFIKGKTYFKITVTGSNNLMRLKENIQLLINHKRERLHYFSALPHNPNIDVIPHINDSLREILKLLSMSFSETELSSTSNYLNRQDHPSWGSLRKLLLGFEKKYTLLNSTISYTSSLYYSLPNIDEDYALNLVKDGYERGFSFEHLAKNTTVSGTTARRVVRGITRPTNTAYLLAESALNLQDLSDSNISIINHLDHQQLFLNIREICKLFGYPIRDLCTDVGLNKSALQSYCFLGNTPPYSTLHSFAKRLREIAKLKSYDLARVRELLDFLHSLMDSNLYFDEITSVEKINSTYDYVYDLDVDAHNFVANNLVVHNSYCSAVLIEELLDYKIPVVIIDPHGEYSTLKYSNDQDKESMTKFGVTPKGYFNSISEYSPVSEINPEAKPLKLSLQGITATELIKLLPAKLGNAQMTALYTALKDVTVVDFEDLIPRVLAIDNPGKWNLIPLLEYVNSLHIFSDFSTPLRELVTPGKVSIINLRGVSIELQEVIVYKLLNDLFRERKLGNVPPFFLVLEECHNFIPERNFKEAKSSSIIRQIFAEGRKFGLGGCLISQRPSRVEKNVLSQCTTQLILKITNPLDVKAVVHSLEGATNETEDAIKNLPIGTALVTGIVDSPLLVQIRPRKTKHGGGAVTVVENKVDEAGLMPLLYSSVRKHDLELMGGKTIKTGLVPCGFYSCGDFSLLVNLVNGELITNLETARGVKLEMPKLSPSELKLFAVGMRLGTFSSGELFAQSGLTFSEVHDILRLLTDKGFFVRQGANYSLAERFLLFRQLEKYACYSKVEYGTIEFDKKFDAVHTLSDFSSVLGNYVTITNQKECYLVIYQVMEKS